VQPGDLIRYRGLEEDGRYPYKAIGLCLREQVDPHYPDHGMKMLVMWFDDMSPTHEDLDVCEKDDWMEIISVSRKAG
jgi:hypothetical protein